MILNRKLFLRMTGIPLLAAAVGKWIDTCAGAVQKSTAAPPAAIGQRRWAMVIDLPKCFEAQDCHRCIAACHQTHNVPEFNDPAHQVNWIWKDSFERAFPSQEVDEYLAARFKNGAVLLFCNHCANPPCVRVCPTQATWKRADGIVMMDYHRCIGCRYCMAGCPYGSRGFNWMDPRPHIGRMNPDFPTRTKGVVEKCNFCEERLSQGQLPACVNACPQKAMTFGDLSDPRSELRSLLAARYTIRRKPELGTNPSIFYLV